MGRVEGKGDTVMVIMVVILLLLYAFSFDLNHYILLTIVCPLHCYLDLVREPIQKYR